MTDELTRIQAHPPASSFVPTNLVDPKLLISGTIELTVDGSEPEAFSPGDAFVIRRGTACTLDVRAPFRKYWMTYEPDAPASTDMNVVDQAGEPA